MKAAQKHLGRSLFFLVVFMMVLVFTGKRATSLNRAFQRQVKIDSFLLKGAWWAEGKLVASKGYIAV